MMVFLNPPKNDGAGDILVPPFLLLLLLLRDILNFVVMLFLIFIP